jgi:predicted ribosome quality control (RQC) complex YloA/Tae2 family protein
MQYGLLKHWVDEMTAKLKDRIITGIEQFEDQMKISILGMHESLQLNLMNKDTFAFFTARNELPFLPTKESAAFQKHMNGTVIKTIEINDSDRILYINLVKTDMYQQTIQYRLIFEMIPTYQNLILTRIDNGKEIVLEAIRKFSLADNPHRQIVQGHPYMLPPQFGQPVKEVDNLATTIGENKRDINSYFESLYYETYLPSKKADIQRSMIKQITSEITKLERKLAKQEVELASAMDETLWYNYAELVKANFNQIKPGMTSLHVTDYFTEGFPEIDIPIHGDKSPRYNMEFYVRKYRKARNGREIIQKHIQEGKLKLTALFKQINKIENIETYLELRSELGKKETKHTAQVKTLFRKLLINDAWEILIGRSSKENDLLTLHTAKSQDWWFHTRIYQGTHVVLRNHKKQELPEDLKQLCARIAAYYSKAKSSSQVPVDYTQIRYIRKPRGSAPGYVTYSHQHTIFVEPISYRDAAAQLSKLLYITNG